MRLRRTLAQHRAHDCLVGVEQTTDDACDYGRREAACAGRHATGLAMMAGGRFVAGVVGWRGAGACEAEPHDCGARAEKSEQEDGAAAVAVADATPEEAGEQAGEIISGGKRACREAHVFLGDAITTDHCAKARLKRVSSRTSWGRSSPDDELAVGRVVEAGAQRRASREGVPREKSAWVRPMRYLGE